MTTTPDEIAQWRASFKQHGSEQTGLALPHLALIHELMGLYLGWLQAASNGSTTLNDSLLFMGVNGTPDSLTELGEFFNERFVVCKDLRPSISEQYRLPDCAELSHQLSGSLELYCRYYLNSEITYCKAKPKRWLISQTLIAQWQNEQQQQQWRDSLTQAAYWINEQQQWCISPKGVVSITDAKTKNKKFYDQLHRIKSQLHAHLQHLRSNNERVHLVRLCIYGHLPHGSTKQLKAVSEHGQRFDGFLEATKKLLQASLLGFHATLRAATIYQTAIWDICLVVDSNWWPDKAFLQEMLQAESVRSSNLDYTSSTHPVHTWMENMVMQSEAEWETFWQRYEEQNIDPMLFMRLNAPKDFRLVRSGRLPRKKSKK